MKCAIALSLDNIQARKPNIHSKIVEFGAKTLIRDSFAPLGNLVLVQVFPTLWEIFIDYFSTFDTLKNSNWDLYAYLGDLVLDLT